MAEDDGGVVLPISDALTRNNEPISIRPPGNLWIEPEDNQYMISEDRLDTIHRGGKDRSFDVAVGLFGASAGFLQNLVAVIGASYAGKTPPTWDLIGAGLFLLCGAAAVAKFTEHRSKKTDVDKLIKRIKEEGKVVPIK
jgi:hypothetical protein